MILYPPIRGLLSLLLTLKWEEEEEELLCEHASRRGYSGGEAETPEFQYHITYWSRHTECETGEWFDLSTVETALEEGFVSLTPYSGRAVRKGNTMYKITLTKKGEQVCQEEWGREGEFSVDLRYYVVEPDPFTCPGCGTEYGRRLAPRSPFPHMRLPTFILCPCGYREQIEP